MAAEGGVCEVGDDEPSCLSGDPLESVKIEQRADSSSEKELLNVLSSLFGETYHQKPSPPTL